jgi:ribosome-associated protein
MTSSQETTSFDTLVIDGIQDRKGKNIKIVDLSEIDGASARKFIICEGSSNMQVSAIADNIRESLLERASIKPYNYDGYRNAEWIVIDYGDVMVHVFQPETRQRYNLEELWSDAPITAVPDLD